MSGAGRSVRGGVNRLIDRVMHPYFRDYPALMLLDGLLHAVAERDPEVSLRKFVGYNAPKLLRYLMNKTSRKARQPACSHHRAKRSLWGG